MEIAPKAPAQGLYAGRAAGGSEQSSSRTRWNSSSSSMQPAMSPRVCSSRRTMSVRRLELRLGARLGGLVEREGLERGEDRADLPELGRGRGGPAGTASRLGGQQAFAGEPEQGLADRSSADAQLGGDGGVAQLGAGGDGAALNALQDLEIHLFAERVPGNDWRHYESHM